MREAAGPGRRVASAGLAAVVGNGAHEISRRLMAERGLDVDGHVAQQLDEELVRGHELILVMEQRHVDDLHARFPESRGRVFRWCHWPSPAGEGGGIDIPDPIGMDESRFRHALTLLDRGLEGWRGKLGL